MRQWKDSQFKETYIRDIPDSALVKIEILW